MFQARTNSFRPASVRSAAETQGFVGGVEPLSGFPWRRPWAEQVRVRQEDEPRGCHLVLHGKPAADFAFTEVGAPNPLAVDAQAGSDIAVRLRDHLQFFVGAKAEPTFSALADDDIRVDHIIGPASLAERIP